MKSRCKIRALGGGGRYRKIGGSQTRVDMPRVTSGPRLVIDFHVTKK